jgi:hypothetical protein
MEKALSNTTTSLSGLTSQTIKEDIDPETQMDEEDFSQANKVRITESPLTSRQITECMDKLLIVGGLPQSEDYQLARQSFVDRPNSSDVLTELITVLIDEHVRRQVNIVSSAFNGRVEESIKATKAQINELRKHHADFLRVVMSDGLYMRGDDKKLHKVYIKNVESRMNNDGLCVAFSQRLLNKPSEVSVAQEMVKAVKELGV